ncbi:MAG: hypothetical protein JW917_08555 [Ignavibacteria bacterium]|nr:hypothetical protein [Ignavibacteria bacterium]
MKINIIFLLFAAVVFSYSGGFAQVKNENNEDKWFLDFWRYKNPTLEVSYGISNAKIDGIVSELQNSSIGELKLGYSSIIRYYRKSSWSKYFYSFVKIGAFSNQIDIRDKKVGAMNYEAWRFGFGKKEGYPLGTEKFSVLPYSSNSYNWSKLEMKQFPDAGLIYDNNRLNMFNGGFSFGLKFEGGLSFRFGKMFAVNIEYEKANIYQRFMVWKNLGSIIIEEAGYGVIDKFVRKILRENPAAGSIVYFVLRNAYSYGIYHLRSQQMNWPFGGESSLNFNTFKTGLSFTF